jgi:hypothetical protein
VRMRLVWGGLLFGTPSWADTGLVDLENWDPYQQGDAPAWAVPGETIVVNSGNQVAQKRVELAAGLKDLGYGNTKRRGEWTVYLADPPWYPKVMVHDSGYMLLKRRGVHFKLPEVADWGGWEKPLELALCLVQPTSCIRVHGLMVSKRRLRWKEQEVVDQTRRQMNAFQDAIADASLAERVAGLVEILNQLWRQGIRPNEAQRVETAALRRQALVEMWQEPASNPWGDTIRSHIEVFVDDVVQTSPHPFTAEEIAEANKGRRSERRFDPIVLE